MLKAEREKRAALKIKHEERQAQEQKARQAKIRKGFRGLWDLVSGASRKQKQRNEAQTKACDLRDSQERETMINEYLKQYQKIQARYKSLASNQQAEKSEK